ncbi:hypothetical protein N7475_002237 [Penicillium sp. IBT 31633x]|nr:hypothetical protein N7475_002237 [Penicillium sp. IBT 31633x]
MSQLDTEAYKTLRLTNRTLCDFVSREVFRVISLYDEEESCKAFKSLIQSPRVKAHVRKIYLNTVDSDYDSDEEGENVPPRG